MYKKLINLINENDTITLFHHIKPDGDCAFSALAFYHFIKDNFKDKKVKITGFDDFNLYNLNHNVKDEFINRSLAIVLDTSDLARIDDKRIINAKYIVKIDHHPAIEQFGNLNIVDPTTAATAELLTNIFRSKDFKKYELSKKVCNYLCCGILTDTLSFKTTNTTAKTLECASYLIEKGNLQLSDLNVYLFNKDIDTFNKVSKLRTMLIVDEKFGYIYLNKKQLQKLKMTADEAKINIDCIGDIKELNIWAFFVEKDGYIDGSLRSKRGFIINKLAYKFNGGGHKNAAGVKKLDEKMYKKLISQLSILANN